MKKKAEKTSKEQALEMQIKLLKEALDNKDKTISRLEIENADLRAQLARRYRRTSEAISSDQLLLFNEAELGVEDGVLNDESDDLPEGNDAADGNPLGDKAKRKYTRHKSEYTMLNLPADTPSPSSMTRVRLLSARRAAPSRSRSGRGCTTLSSRPHPIPSSGGSRMSMSAPSAMVQ